MIPEPSTPPPPPRYPLEDIRILALEQFGAGPFGSLHLAELGADVIKIEDPRTGGDVSRYVPPYQEQDESLHFETFNRNKRSLSLDITNPAGRGVFEDLVRRSDAVYSNLRGDVPERLRIRYVDLEEVNEMIVCCSLSGFGMTGPRAAQPAYDYVLQGLAGWMALTGEPDGPPAKSGLSLVDFTGGLVAAISLLAGVHAARRDGRGLDCDVSLFDAALAMLTYPATWHLTAGFRPARTARSAHPSVVPFQLFPTADGWMVVACAKEKFWKRLGQAIGRPALAEDPRFAGYQERARNAGQLVAILDEAFRRRTTVEWIRDLEAAGVPCAPVNTPAEALRDPQAEARRLIVQTDHPRFGPVRHVRTAVRAGQEPPPARRAPRRNEHAGEILRDLLGYDDRAVERLAARGAFGSTGSITDDQAEGSRTD